MTVYNPIWLQMIFYIAIALFPCLSGFGFYLAYEALLNSESNDVAYYLFLALAVGYISYIGLLLAKFVAAKVVFDDGQFTVEIKGKTNSYAWTDIASVKNHEATQILRLFDANGTTIYVVDHMTPGYEAFAEKVNEVVGL